MHTPGAMCTVATISVVILWILQSAHPVDAALPPGYEDQLFCPPGRCMEDKKNMQPGFVGPATAFKVCVSKSSDPDQSSPKGWGNKKPESELKALKDGMWHSTTCTESNYVCNFGKDTAEWAICRVTSHFLLKMLGELNGGDTKTVAHVYSMLAPYLGGPKGIGEVTPVGVPADFTPAKAADALMTLYLEVDEKDRERYEALKLDGAALAQKTLAGLPQETAGKTLLKDMSDGSLNPKEVTVQQVLFGVLNNNAWQSSQDFDHKSSYATGGVLLAVVFFVVLGGVVWRRRKTAADHD